MPRSVYPEQFFDIPHPTAPLTQIQFRNNVDPGVDFEDSDNWESITFNPNNFFDELTIEDSGGLYELQLSLFDKNFARLENTIVRSLVATRLANQLIENPEYEEDPSYFQFYVSNQNNANLRVRFGYSESTDSNYISANKFTQESWRDRTNNEEPVILSPWIYFQMLDADFNFTPNGLSVSIKAFSTMNNFLEKAKLVETYAELTGKPTDVINQVGNKIVDAAERNGETIEVEIRDQPLGYLSRETGEEKIEIMLGGEPTVTGFNEVGQPVTKQKYKSLKGILNDIADAVRPIKYDSDGNLIDNSQDTSEEATAENEENEEADEIYKYSYYIAEEEDKTKIVFYYRNPQNAFDSQETVRTYLWLQEGNSIVYELDVKTETDFATLNLPFAEIDKSSGEIRMYVARGRSESGNEEDDFDFRVGHVKNVSSALNDEGFDSVFVRGVTEMDERTSKNDDMSPDLIGAKISSAIISELNNQVFQGEMTIQGDPFYLFDDSMQPFSYLIKIIVNRPNYVDENGEFQIGGKSYLSGYYAVKKITHTISDDFITTLDLMKWNSKERS